MKGTSQELNTCIMLRDIDIKSKKEADLALEAFLNSLMFADLKKLIKEMLYA